MGEMDDLGEQVARNKSRSDDAAEERGGFLERAAKLTATLLADSTNALKSLSGGASFRVGALFLDDSCSLAHSLTRLLPFQTPHNLLLKVDFHFRMVSCLFSCLFSSSQAARERWRMYVQRQLLLQLFSFLSGCEPHEELVDPVSVFQFFILDL